MNKTLFNFAICTFLAIKCFGASPVKTDSLEYGKFGKVYIYKSSDAPSQVVLFISGDAGWKYGVVDMAKTLAKRNYLVVGIDIRRYMKNLQKNQGQCYEISPDFDLLDQVVQKKQHLPRLIDPIVAGYSSGATLAYAVLAQALPQTFRGGVGIGFCPDMEINRPFCARRAMKSEPMNGKQGFNLLPSAQMKLPFSILLGELDRICDLPATKRFMSEIPNGKSFFLPKVGHGYSVQKNWMPQFKQAFDYVISHPAKANTKPAQISKGLQNLPISIMPAKTVNKAMPLVIFISGDGGWKGIDYRLGKQLAEHGAPVVALDALRYFWKPSNPQQTTKDIVRIINAYKAAWNKQGFVMIGYSFGADIVPFVINRLPAELKSHVREAILLSPDSHADFEFHLSSWWGALF